MESKSYDIVLLPEQNISNRAIELSENLYHHDTYFTLGNEEYFPHISLYMLQMNPEGLDRAKLILGKIAAIAETIVVESSKYHFESGYFDIEFVKTNELIDIQNEIIKQINPFRHGLRRNDIDRLATVSGEEKDNILQFGYRNVGSLFAPHLTFTRFKDVDMKLSEGLPDLNTFDGKFTSIGIFEMGEHGTCRTKVKTWPLE